MGSCDLSGNIAALVDVVPCSVVILVVDDFALLAGVVDLCFAIESNFAPVLDFNDVARITSDGMLALGFVEVVHFNFSPTTDFNDGGTVTAGVVDFEGSEGLFRKPLGVLHVVTVETMVVEVESSLETMDRHLVSNVAMVGRNIQNTHNI